MKFEIKNRFSGELIVAVEAENWRVAVELAIKQKANLRSADLRSADLRHANLRYANLSYANLRSADLRYANLSSADLSYADLRSADLSYADLRSANLRSADLSYADLRSADLSYADLRSANLLIFQYQRDQAFFTTKEGALRIGCVFMPISEWLIGYKDIGKKNNYTDLQIEMYGDFIKMCAKIFEAESSK